ncbi:MAG: hypothetical protein WBA17_04630 [Saprospiraceae bacterium]
MALFSVFRLPSHQRFSYKPRYWDPKKEELDERLDRLRQLEEGGVDGVKARISGGFKRGAGGAASGRYRGQQVKRSNMTLFIIIGFLVMISYLLFYVYMPQMEGWLQAAPPQ